MKKNVLLNLCLIIFSVTAYAADGVVQDIDKICSFRFPAAPQITDVMGMKNYLYTTDSCSYLVQMKPVTKEGVVHDSATLTAFYGGLVKGALRGAHGSLIGQKPIIVNGMREVEMEYVKSDQNHQPVSVCSRLLLLGDHLIVYTFSAPYERFASLKYVKDSFFASFALNKVKPAPAKQAASDTADLPTPIYDSVTAKVPAATHRELMKPNTLRFIISFAVCILLLAGILYVLVRWKKKK